MAVDDRLKNLRGTSRRDFLRWSAAVAAVLGLERARYLNVLGEHGGQALADVAAGLKRQKWFHFNGGNGGLAWAQVLWPAPAVATSTNANYAFHELGKAVKVAGTDKDLYYASQSPFQKLSTAKQMTCMLGGQNRAHTGAPALLASAGVDLLASVAAIGLADSSLLPVIQIGNASYGAAPGAPAVASVATPDGMVDLFNSAASKAILQKPEDASLHEAYYKAFLGLNAAAGRSTNIKQLGVSKVAVNLLGKNLSDQLRPSAADLTEFGVTGAVPTNVQNIAKSVIIGLNAFKLGLTNMVIVPFMFDDPHGAFAGGDAPVATRAQQLGTIFDAMMKKAATIQDPAGGSKSLAESLGFSIAGDTPKQAFTRGGWPDGSPGNSNNIYVFGNGYLKTGWFGDLQPGAATGWSAETGANVPGKTSVQTENEAVAALLYAVAKGDAREVLNFARVPSLAGVTRVLLS
jgi:hypothetical protein